MGRNGSVTSYFVKDNEVLEACPFATTVLVMSLFLPDGPRTSNPPSCTSSPWPSSPWLASSRSSEWRSHTPIATGPLHETDTLCAGGATYGFCRAVEWPRAFIRLSTRLHRGPQRPRNHRTTYQRRSLAHHKRARTTGAPSRRRGRWRAGVARGSAWPQVRYRDR